MDKSKAVAGLTVVMSLLVGGSSLALRSRHDAPVDVQVHFEALPMQFLDFRGAEERFREETYTVLHADTTTLRHYEDTRGGPLWLFVAYFGSQNYGEQIHSPRNCLPGSGWQIVTSDRVYVPLEGRGQVETNRLLIRAGSQQQVMYYFFITRLGTVASEFRLKLDLARAALTFKPRDAIFVRISVPYNEGEEQTASDRALRLMESGIPLLSKGLPF